MVQNFCWSILLIFLLAPWHVVHAEESTEQKRFNFRINPLIVAIRGNLDLDVRISSQWTIGPSFFGWGGCGNRTQEVRTREGNQCDTWVAYGLRSNYYFADDSPVRGLYIGPGIYKVEKSFDYGFAGQALQGKINGTAVTALVGYMYRASPWFNLSGGIGGLYFIEKPSDLTVTGESAQTVISSGSSTQFLAEFSLGFAF